MTIPIVRQRAKRPKTRTGCKTCRARHIKCDEQRPVCQKCLSSNRTCSGYSSNISTLSSQTSRVLLPANQPPKSHALVSLTLYSTPVSTAIRLTTQEWQGIQFFRGQTDFHLPGSSLGTSWETLALQMSISEPAIACAVAALGLMQLARRGLPSLPVYSSAMDHVRGTLALQKYVQATSRIHNLIKDVATADGRKGIETVLVACLVLMCFEFVRGGGAQAAMHLRNGLRILHSCVGIPSDGEPTQRLVRVKRDPRSSLDTLTRLFVCLDCNIATFGANGNAYLHAIYDTPETSPASMLPSVPTSFDSLEEAAWHFSALSKAVSCARGKLLKVSEEACSTGYSEALEEVSKNSRIQVLSRWISLSGHPELVAELRQLECYVETWSHAISNMPMESGSSENSSHTALRIQFFVTWLFAAFWRDPSETMGDRHHHAFANFLELVKINLQSDSLQRPKSDLLKGAMSLLFLLACKCRNSTIRWTAVSLLHDLKLQEGAFHSEVLAMFACQIVRLEESRAREITGIEESYLLTYEDVPEQARFMDVTLDLDESQPDLGILVCARLSDDDEGGIIVEKHCFAISEVAGLPHSLATRG